MDDPNEPTLPPMPSLPSTSRFYQRPQRPSLNTRKRTHSTLRSSSSPPSASSDPALFSGDDEAAAENYVPETKRKKKMYSGSWWNHRVKAGREERKREFKRNVDSGVFMMGDESEEVEIPSSDSLGSLESELIKDLEEKESEGRVTKTGTASDGRMVRWRRSLQRLDDVTCADSKESSISSQHAYVNHMVLRHLDQCNENVDLSDLDLFSLPTDIAQLATLSTEPNLVPGMLDTGRPFEASLTLMLCNNLFRDFPSPLLELSNLKVLSLRSNQLKTIPGGIRRLTNLASLSVGGNKLSYLPFEILELAKFHQLRVLHAHPNPWNLDHIETEHVYEATRPVSTRAMTARPATSGSPSLTETALRQLYRLSPRGDLSSFMPLDTPGVVLNALDDLTAAQHEGGRHCTLCKRMVVTPGDQWLEYWPISQGISETVFMTEGQVRGEDLIPFKRLACQSGCLGRENAWADVVRRCSEGDDGEEVAE